MKALLVTMMTALAMTASAQLPANGFDEQYAIDNWHFTTYGDKDFYLSTPDFEENVTWAYNPVNRVFLFLFSDDAFGYSRGYNQFAKLPGRVDDRSFFPSYADGHLDYNAISLAVGSGSANIEIYKRFDDKLGYIMYNKQTACVTVSYYED